MKILMLNWRDLKNPKGGGAEVLTEGILAELAKKGHEIVLFTASFPNARKEEIVNGYKIIRRGHFYSIHILAFWYWITRFNKENFDVVIDQIHGIPFFTPLYISKSKRFAFIHEVAKDIWFEMFPFPLSYIGYAIEYLSLQFYRNTRFITVSDSTKGDLIKTGIPQENISITPEGIIIPPEMIVPKNSNPTILFVGRLAPMKRVEQFLKTAAIIKKKISNLETWIVGGGEEGYVNTLKTISQDLGVNATFYGRPEDKMKYELMGKAHILSSASIREGYGLVILEAGTMSTPSVTYNVHGFRDVILDGNTGILSKENTPESLAESILELLRDKEKYEEISKRVREYSREFTFENAGNGFEKIISEK